jgi:regulator of ribosome biosynthesis
LLPLFLQHLRRCRQECDEQLEFDVGHLLATCPSTPEDPSIKDSSEEALRCLATRATQSLVRKIFSLPSHSTPDGHVVELPKPTFTLPRAKPVPKPKPLTKWQKFAQEKGIEKKKRSKLVFDEDAQDWKRRHGYKRGNDEVDVPFIEASEADKVCSFWLFPAGCTFFLLHFVSTMLASFTQSSMLSVAALLCSCTM